MAFSIFDLHITSSISKDITYNNSIFIQTKDTGEIIHIIQLINIFCQKHVFIILAYRYFQVEPIYLLMIQILKTNHRQTYNRKEPD
jgi:hypothetical protein